MLSSSMPMDVRERLLGDAVHGSFDGCRKLTALAEIDIDLEPRARRKTPSKRSEGVSEIIRFELWGMSEKRKGSDFLLDLLHHLAAACDPAFGCRICISRKMRQVQLQGD